MTNVKVGDFIENYYHVGLIAKMPEQKETYCNLKCYECKTDGLICEDVETGLDMHFSAKDGEDSMFLSACAAGRCYRFHSKGTTDETAGQAKVGSGRQAPAGRQPPQQQTTTGTPPSRGAQQPPPGPVQP